MSDAVEYDISGDIFIQDFLTIDQWEKFIKVTKDINFKGKNISDALSILRKSGKLNELLNLILSGPREIDYNEIKPIILIKIIKDFFSINEVSKSIGETVSMIFEIMEDKELIALMSSIPAVTQSMKKITDMIGIDSSQQSQTETLDNITTSEKK